MDRGRKCPTRHCVICSKFNLSKTKNYRFVKLYRNFKTIPAFGDFYSLIIIYLYHLELFATLYVWEHDNIQSINLACVAGGFVWVLWLPEAGGAAKSKQSAVFLTGGRSFSRLLGDSPNTNKTAQ